jgi:hypothetical protein
LHGRQLKEGPGVTYDAHHRYQQANDQPPRLRERITQFVLRIQFGVWDRPVKNPTGIATITYLRFVLWAVANLPLATEVLDSSTQLRWRLNAFFLR